MKRSGVIGLICLTILSIGLSIWSIVSIPKVAYIRSAEMVSKYEGMKEAEKLYNSKEAQWQANLDTLSYGLQRSINNYETNYTRWSSSQKSEAQASLKRQQQNIEQYKQSIEQKAGEEKEKITQGALNQINAFVENYAKEKGYKLVVGVTLSGNVLYGDESIDITEEVIKGLNESYKK